MSTRPLARLLAAAALVLLALPAVAGPALAENGSGDTSGNTESVPVTVTVPELAESPDGPARLTNAELRWSLNAESNAGNWVGCNFLMAGVPGKDGNSGGSREWSGADRGLYRAKQGDVRVVRTVADGSQEQATWATKCSTPDGAPAKQGQTTGSEVVLVGGTGTRAEDGSLSVRWKGTFTVVFYSGMTYWWVTDPVLTLDSRGTGKLTATGGGFAADMDDTTKWSKLSDTPITLATFRGQRLTGTKGGTLAPDYCQVPVDGDPTSPQMKVAAGDVCWGSFPQDFVDFQSRTGQWSYWYSSGGEADKRKKAAPVAVSFDAANSVGSSIDPDDLVDSGSAGGTGTPTGSGAGAGPGSGSGSGVDDGAGSGSGSAAGSGPGSGSGATPVARNLRPAALAAASDDGTLTAFPAVAAATLGADAAALVPELLAAVGDSDRLALLTTGTLLTASGAVVGFRRRWLVLPFRH